MKIDFSKYSSPLKAFLRTAEFIVGIIFFGWSPALILFGLYCEFILEWVFSIARTIVGTDQNKVASILSTCFINGVCFFLYTIFFIINDFMLNREQGIVFQISLYSRQSYWNEHYIEGFVDDMASVFVTMLINYILIFLINYKTWQKQENEPTFMSRSTVHLHFSLCLGFLAVWLYWATQYDYIIRSWPYLLISLTLLIEMSNIKPVTSSEMTKK